MSICPMCKNDYNEVELMRDIVETAEVLIDAAASSDDITDVAAKGADLRFAVHKYRAINKQFDEHGGEDAVQ